MSKLTDDNEAVLPPLDKTTTRPDDNGADVGNALRNAFAATVEEQVPDEMLDLLRRLN